ncbi:MAG: hypothetical protein C0602_07560 [Denitrovibrio sp.]|nr:MAG: hypothetical protein C0602_07560 [Denitrovibrio sp.]
MFRLITIILLTISIAGCMGTSDETSARSKPQSPSGIWIGTQYILNDSVYDMKSIIYDGRIIGMSEDAGVMFAGTYEMKEGRFLVSDGQPNSSTTYKLYDLYNNNNVFAIGMVGANVDQRNRIKGSFLNDANQEGEIDLSYTELYEKTVSVADIQGNWSTSRIDISIDEDGIIAGTLDNCAIDGEASTPEQGRNIFAINITLSECSNAGFYNGLGTIIQDNSASTYFIALTSNSERMENFGFELDEMPTSFTQTSEQRTSYSAEMIDDSSQILSRTLDTHTGENHDGEDFTGKSLHYNISDASYKNAVFNNASFVAWQLYTGLCDSFLTSYRCEKYGNFPIEITNSDFSGSTFYKTTLGAYKRKEQTGYYINKTKVTDYDFSRTSFTGNWTLDGHFLIDATNTDFTESSFTNYVMEIDTTTNIYTGNTFNNSTVKLLKGDLERAVLDGSSLFAEQQGSTLKDITLNDSTLYLDKPVTLNNIVLNSSALVVNTDDVDLTGITINSLTSLELSRDIDLSGWDLSNTEVFFNAWKLDDPYVFFYNGYASGRFEETNFKGSSITASIADTDTIENVPPNTPRYLPTYVFHSNFSKSYFSDATFNKDSIHLSYYEGGDVVSYASFYDCDFTAANFANADLSGAEFQFSTMNYANFTGAEKPETSKMITSYYGNSWWFNGDRCLPGSIGTCLPVPDALNTGLTYEEYMNGKSDLDKAAENVKKEAKDLIDEGIGFVKDIGSGASDAAKYLFGW